MREVALTVDGFGLDGAMSRASADWQQRIGDMRLSVSEAEAEDYRILADQILGRLESHGT